MMKMIISNDETGMHLTLKNSGDLTSQDVLNAFNLVERRSYDEVHEGDIKFLGTPREMLARTTEGAKPRPRAIEKIGSERSLNVNLGELTKIKEKSKVYVNCPNCSFEGDAQTWQGNYYSKCPNCEVKLFNSWATGSPDENDADGYEYHATSEYRNRA